MEFRAVMRSNPHLLILLIILFFSLVGEIAAVARGGELRRKDFPGDFIFGTASSAYQYEGAVREGGRGPSIWDTFTHSYPEIAAVARGGELRRKDFPGDFIFGTASSAYQYEGAVREGGRGPSIWDTFTHNYPERIADKSTGDTTIDFYHRYKEDVRMMKDLGFDAFRFSISWSRILPKGSLSGGVNKDGVQYYNNLINELISNDMKPFVTLFHWDFPQALQDKYGGFLSPQIVDDFASFAGVCFREFGDRVKHWITMNEPWTFTIFGYAEGSYPPRRCSVGAAGECSAGDSGREPYTVAHHLILAHAASVRLYRQNFQASQKGQIGITLITLWMLPYSNSKADKEAANRALDFMYGWFMDPLTRGDYPSSMREHVGHRLPKFTEKQTKMIKGSYDFIGLNYYTAIYAHNLLNTNGLNPSYDNDISANFTEYREGVPIGPQAASKWLYVYPRGIYDLLLYTKTKYNNPVIYITENGISEMTNGSLPTEKALKDDTRIDYYRQHLINVRRANRKGVDVRGFFAWSMFDNFEWTDGYKVRFGICFVDYKDGLKRYPKNSALWFQRLLS